MPMSIDVSATPARRASTTIGVICLSDFIAENNALIVDECEAFARTLGPVAEDMDREALRDHLGQILDAIAAEMKVAQSESERAEKSKGRAPSEPREPEVPGARTHGALRAASGFDVNQTAAEYRALRASVIRLWLQTSPPLGPTQVEELTRFNEAMDQALAETLLQFAANAAESRNLFLGVLSHELRTPLGTMVGSAESLLHVANQHPLLRDASKGILRGGRRIESVLDDLLDFVRSGVDGGMRLNPVEVRLDDLCARLAQDVEAAFPGSRIELVQNGDMAGCWDEQRIAQALSNLMSNAIKYGARDTPILVSLTGTEADELVVEVYNRGPAMAPEKLETLFQPLVRGVGEDPTGYSLGLGLFIVREIATAHAGAADVESSGNGTTFRLRLPRAPNSRPSAIAQMRRI